MVTAAIATIPIVIARSEIPLLALWNTKNEQSALDYWHEARYEDVVAVLEEELSSHPMDAEALSLRGFAKFYLSLEQVDGETAQMLLVESIRDLRRAIIAKESRLEPEIHFVLGKSYYHRGAYYYDSAIYELETALASGIENVEIYEYLGITYRDVGDTENARTYLGAAAELGGEFIHYLVLADLERDAGMSADAEALYRKIISGTQDGIILQRSLTGLASTYRGRQLYDDAMSTYRSLLEVNPASADAHFGMGEVYLALEQTDRARFEWREALRLDPNHIESFDRLQEY